MDIYIQKTEKEIDAIDTEYISPICEVLKVDSIDDFYNQTSGFSLTEEIEEQLHEIFESRKSSQIEGETKPVFRIKHWVSNRSFGELIDMYESGEIKKPEMQRQFVWDSQKSSRLVESIILGLPIPPLFFMELDGNMYEIIDGFQRITAITNYVMGRPWGGVANGKDNRASRLTGSVMQEIKGKSFENLDLEYQRVIKRSTIPLIEFRQISPEDVESKYLIFERINTGSEQLNPMQIRKSLAYGSFIKSLYDQADRCDSLKKLFSHQMQKKDVHVEALLRVIAMSDIYYNKKLIKRGGIKNILNDYCEENKNTIIREDFYIDINSAITKLEAVFGSSDNLFRRVEFAGDNKGEFVGNLNTSILEAMLGVMINSPKIEEDEKKIKEKYISVMIDIMRGALKKKENNPFNTSTGTIESINKRFAYMEQVLEL